MADYYPPVGFHFSVGLDDITGTEDDSKFQSVGGLKVEMETESIKEGGENRFVHVLPVRSKYPNLVLKRGMFVNSELIDWCLDAFENLDIQPADLTISLLSDDHTTPLKTWKVKKAWPLKWNITDLSAEESKIVVETIELNYQFFTVE